MGRRIKKPQDIKRLLAARTCRGYGKSTLEEERECNNSSNTITGRTIEVYQLLRNIKEYITNQKKSSTKRAAAVRGQHQQHQSEQRLRRCIKSVERGFRQELAFAREA